MASGRTVKKFPHETWTQRPQEESIVTTPVGLRVLALITFIALPPAAAAQTLDAVHTVPDPNPGPISLRASFDFTNVYMFRGLLQDDTRFMMFPEAQALIDLHDDDDGLRDVVLRISTWNSLNRGVTGSGGPSGKMWYESRFSTGLDFTFDPGVTVGGGYTAYTSPNNSFSTVKELAFRVTADDRVAPAGLALRPHALIAFELGTAPGLGQADGGDRPGTYLEFGVAPTVSESGFALMFPIKVGLSLKDYYELAAVDHPFGFLSLGAIARVPLGQSRDYGAWDVHGGFEFLSLGDTPEAFNRGDQTQIVGVVGIGYGF
jgi:hypothetical protein